MKWDTRRIEMCACGRTFQGRSKYVSIHLMRHMKRCTSGKNYIRFIKSRKSNG